LHLFILAGLALNLTPGPDMLYVAGRGAAQGRLAGVVSALAITTGGLAHLAGAVAGISAFIMLSATFFQVLKWAGAAYLIYLGLKSLFVRQKIVENQYVSKKSLTVVYKQGILVSALNPKVALFFLSFLPQFIDPQTPDTACQSAFLGLVFMTTGTIVNVMVGLSAGYLGERLKTPRAQKIRLRLTGGLFVTLGLGLALADLE
jgi:threonine/homoserine/homoserine lactone efflux protein